MKHILFIMTAVFLLFVSCAKKQTVKPEEEEAVTPPAVEELVLPDITIPVTALKEEKADKTVPEEKKEEQFIMLNFENADLSTVITTISEMLQINYILAPGISGKITIQSHTKIPLSELFPTFQLILEFNGFTAVKDGSFYRIVPITTVKQQPVPVELDKDYVIREDAGFVTQKIPLEYVQANKVVNIIRNLMPKGTDIIAYEPTNVLIVTAAPTGIVKLLKLLEIIDIPASDSEYVRTFVYHVENGEAKRLASILKKIYADKDKKKIAVSRSAPSRTEPAVPTRSTLRRPAKTPQTATVTVQEGLPGEIEGEVILIEAYDDINALLIKATPRGYISLLESIKMLDIQPKQVLIEVLIAEISLTDNMEFGIEWLLRESGSLEGGFTDGGITIGEEGITTAIPTGTFASIVDPRGFRMLISAAATNGNLNVLGSPHVLALDNKEAKIEIASEVPVATSISQPQATTSNTISQVQFKSVGTILTVTPHINDKKQVTLKILQEVSEIGDPVQIAGQAYTGFNTRKASTTAIVQDGHTLVIGGIINETKNQSRSGIPFLSKIPILGYLFGTTTDQLTRRELILMVTPHVVSSHEEADMLTVEYKNRIRDVKKRIEERERRLRGNRAREQDAMGKALQSDIHLHDHDDQDEQKENGEKGP
jgi:type II secretory pathway component GspD/PulD (secretin)